MSSTRSVISPPVFAQDANTSIPPTPIQGVSYRDPVAGPASSPDGWPYGEVVNSAEFNQIMYQITTLLGLIDKKGILGWSDQVDYTVSSITLGSDGSPYFWLQASGPNNGGARDPISNPTYWGLLPKGFATSSEIISGVVSDKSVSPLGLLASFLGAGGISSSDYVKIPFRDKTSGVRRELIVQWGVTGTISSGTNATITFPLSFPTAHLGVATGGRGTLNSTVPTYYAWEPISVSQFRIYNQSTKDGFTNWVAWGY